MQVPQGIVIVQNDRPDNLPDDVPFNQFFVLEDDSELSGSDIENPEQQTDPQTQQPVVTMEFTDKGRPAFERLTKRVAERGSKIVLPPGADPQATFQRFAITLDNEIVSNATIDWQELPEGIDGRTGAQIEGVGDLQAAQDLAEQLRIGALPIDLKLISQTQVSATLGKQALHQGLIAGAAGLAADAPVPGELLPRARPGGGRGACDLRRPPLRAREAGADHAHAPRHRRPDPDAGHRGRREHRRLRARQGGGARRPLDTRGDLGRLRQGPAHDHRRERRDHRGRVHPLHAGHGRREGLRVHARRRHACFAVHGGAGHLGDPRADEPLPPAALTSCAGRRLAAVALALRLHRRLEVVLLDVGPHPRGLLPRPRRQGDQLRHRLRVGHAHHRTAAARGERRRRPRRAARRVPGREDPGGRRPGAGRATSSKSPSPSSTRTTRASRTRSTGPSASIAPS